MQPFPYPRVSAPALSGAEWVHLRR